MICRCRAGVMVFQSTMRDWHFRPVFWVSTALKCAAAVIDIVIIERWNIDIGINDHVMYMAGYNIIYQVIKRAPSSLNAAAILCAPADLYSNKTSKHQLFSQTRMPLTTYHFSAHRDL